MGGGPLNRERAAQIAERYSLPFFLSMMLEIRGFSSEEQIRGLLSGGQLSDPFLMKDMDKAAARIRRAMEISRRLPSTAITTPTASPPPPSSLPIWRLWART